MSTYKELIQDEDEEHYQDDRQRESTYKELIPEADVGIFQLGLRARVPIKELIPTNDILTLLSLNAQKNTPRLKG